MLNKAKRLALNATRKLTASQTVGGAAIIISFAYLLSRLLGLLRDRLLIAHFGKGALLDSYNAAFRLPDLLFTLLVSGAFAVAFIPVLTAHLEKEERADAWRVTSALFNILVLATAVGGALVAIFADPLTTLIAPGFDDERHRVTVELTRILMITPVFFAISSVWGSVQQAFNRFLLFAFAGVFYNIGIIAGVVWLAPQYSIYGVAIGVIAGVVIQAAVSWAGLYGLGFRYCPTFGLKLTGVRQTLKLMLPRSLDQGLDQINYIVETMVASPLPQGSVTALTLANNLKNVPLVLLASSISTAVFPQLAAKAAKGERGELIKSYVSAARLILFLAIPSAVFAVIMRGYIVRLLYGFGDADTANTLGWFAGTIVFSSLFMLVSRVYYAMQDTRTPFFLSLASIPVNIVLSIILSKQFGVAGLAMSASAVAAAETILLLLILRRQGHFGGRVIFRGAWRMTAAAAVMGFVLHWVITESLPLFAVDRGFATLAPKFAALSLVALAAYLIPCWLLNLSEARAFAAKIRRWPIWPGVINQ